MSPRTLATGRVPSSGRVPPTGRQTKRRISYVGGDKTISTTTSLTLRMPKDTQDGDIALLINQSYGAVTGGLASWPPADPGSGILYKFLVAGEPNVVLTYNLAGWQTALLLVFRGVSTTNPFHKSSVRFSYSGTSIPITAATPTIAGTMAVIMSYLSAGSANIKIPPSGWYKQLGNPNGDLESSTQSGAVGACWKPGPASGVSTGTPGFTTLNPFVGSAGARFVLLTPKGAS